jgi:fermentation-respiration switch protein FrsA (DUF1100 family)
MFPLLLGLGVLALVFVGWWLRDAIERALLFKPGRVVARRPEEAGRPGEEITLRASDGVRLCAWWFPHPDARGTLLFCHGNTGTVAERLWLVEDLRDFPVNLLLLDYRGYGRSEGQPGMEGIDRDVRAAHDWVCAQHGVSADPPLVLWGRSLGGAIATRLAAERPPRGLVLECTFTSVAEMGQRFYPYLFGHRLSRNRYDTLALLPRLQVPLLLAHSRDDQRIPPDMGRRLFAAAAEPKTFCELVGLHAEAGWRTTPAYREVFQRFVLDCLARPPLSP